jgi:hypothetical protein
MPNRPLDRFAPPTWPSADVSDIDPVWRPYKTRTAHVERPSKRRRIEEHALTVILGEPLTIQSAALKGPFDKESWSNPWHSNGYDVQLEELAADPIEEESARAPTLQIPTKQQHSKSVNSVVPNQSTQTVKKPDKGKAIVKTLPPVAPPETTWLRKASNLELEHDAVQDDLPEPTPSKTPHPVKPTQKRPTKIVKPKSKAAPKRKITRKIAKAQPQLPLVNVSKVNRHAPSKQIETEAAQSSLKKTQQAVPKPFDTSNLEAASNNQNSAGPRDIERSLARIERNLKQGMTKENDRKRRFMTFTSPLKDSPHKRWSIEDPVAQERKSPVPQMMPLTHPDPLPIIETSFVLDDQQIADYTEARADEQADPASAVLALHKAPQLADVSNASKLADAALYVLQMDTNLQRQAVISAVASNSGTIMNDTLHDRGQENIVQPQVVQQEESSEHIRVSSYPEHQDSKAYSSTSLDMATQTALYQAQTEFHAQFADDSPSLISISRKRNSIGHIGNAFTPARTLRKSQRLSLNALGSTQDLIQAAQQVDFTSTRKGTTIKKGERAILIPCVPPKRSSPPRGIDENRDPSHPSRVQHAGMQDLHKPSSQQPSSQPRFYGSPLKDISSQQSNSQHPTEENAAVPVISFMPSVAHSADLKLSGAPAASWQIGQGQQVLDDMEKSFDLNRSLDEALEFLNVDYEF